MKTSSAWAKSAQRLAFRSLLPPLAVRLLVVRLRAACRRMTIS
jgi:hypothetical protein